MQYGAQIEDEMHKETTPVWKQKTTHEESLKRIDKILPRIDTWFDLGSTIDLTLRPNDEFLLEDNVMTTMALDARIVPHTVQLPIVKIRKKRRK
ncbi:MAG: hypothetical protein AUF65_00910 [Chloroflexi bacterium 13_1_20CM_50_12]|nr:MAG: hypothetical protein AUF65_00910 [Chloroflexi bacterium 13_1_20CM_50_12]